MQPARPLDRDALVRWCAIASAPAGAFAASTLAALFALECSWSPDPQRFCVWWSHSWLPTLVGLPASLAFGCWASLETGSRRPVTVAAILVVLTCVYLRAAAAPAY